MLSFAFAAPTSGASHAAHAAVVRDPGARTTGAGTAAQPVTIHGRNGARWGGISFEDPQLPSTLARLIVRGATNNGAWFHSKHLWVQNEDTAKMPNLVDRRSFEDLLKRR